MSENNNSELIELPSAEESGEREMKPLFTLDGEVYSIPEKVSAGLSLAYLRIQAEQGPDAAIYYITREMLGDEVYETLENHPSLETEHLEKVMEAIETHVLSGGKGKSRGGTRQRRSKK